MKVLFLVPYPVGESPSQRFRFEQYFSILNKNQVSYHVQSFLTRSNWLVFYSNGRIISKILALITGFMRRFFALLHVGAFDFIFIHREVTPVGPPVFEWVIAKVFRKKIIYDFDDAIWMTDKQNESALEKAIRWRSKVGSICQWSHVVSCGNEYLRDFAAQFNKQSVINPTTIDTELLHNPDQFTKNTSPSVMIGWTGSHSTLKYLTGIEGALREIENQFSNVQFLVIANKKPDLNLQRLHFVPWKKETEAADLMKIDIGIMPLPDDEWTKGKCGFKALQYMALEIPTVASPVGVNTKIVTQGKEGFLAGSEQEWISCLTRLIEDFELRKKMGAAGRDKIIENYSVLSNTSNFLRLFT